MRRRFLVAGISLVVVLGSALGFRALARRLSGVAPTPVLTVSKGPFVRRVMAEGNLKAGRATPLVGPGTGLSLKIAWLMDDGSPVKAGDVVVRFDPTLVKKNLDAGRDERTNAGERTGKTRAEAGAALRNLDHDVRQSRLELETAKTFQSKDPELFSRHEIIEADIDVGLAGSREVKARESKPPREALAQADLELLGIDTRKANLKIQRAETELKALEIRAPHDGFVVFNRDWRGELPAIGQTVWSGFKLAEIPDVASMQAEVWVLEADAGGLLAGRAATVVVESDPDVVHTGKIQRVDGVPKPRVRGAPVQYFGVIVALDASKVRSGALKPGQRVQALLLLDERSDAIAIPRQAVFDRESKKVVYRRKSGRFDPVEVTLGPAALGRVVVEKGLEAGDVIALADPAGTPGKATPTPSEASPVKRAAAGPP
jgi:HlyD family secretion protein